MNDKVKWCDGKGEFFDFGNDFTLLTNMEKQSVLKTAKTYWKLLKDNDALPATTENDPSSLEAEKLRKGIVTCDLPLKQKENMA